MLYEQKVWGKFRMCNVFIRFLLHRQGFLNWSRQLRALLHKKMEESWADIRHSSGCVKYFMYATAYGIFQHRHYEMHLSLAGMLPPDFIQQTNCGNITNRAVSLFNRVPEKSWIFWERGASVRQAKSLWTKGRAKRTWCDEKGRQR